MERVDLWLVAAVLLIIVLVVQRLLVLAALMEVVVAVRASRIHLVQRHQVRVGLGCVLWSGSMSKDIAPLIKPISISKD